MPRPPAGDRIQGPYREPASGVPPEGVRFKIIRHVEGTRDFVLFPRSGRAHTEREIASAQAAAEQYAEEARRALAGVLCLTVEDALSAFLAEVLPTLKALSARTLQDRVRSFFEGVETELLSSLLKAGRCAELYAALTRRPNKRRAEGTLSATQHRRMLKEARRFLRWCVDKKLLRENPLDAVKPQGRIGRRKRQHRVDEARRFYAKAMELAYEGTPAQQQGATAVLTALELGLRQSEVTLRVVRDLDDDARLFHIDEGKTDASKGTMEVPEDLRPLLLRQAAGKGPNDPLFSNVYSQGGGGEAMGPAWLRVWTRQISVAAGLPPITAHALRGMFGSLGVTTGALPHRVSEALRQADEEVAPAHYIEPAAMQAAQQRRLHGLLHRDADHDLRLRLEALAAGWELAGQTQAAQELRDVLGNASPNVPQRDTEICKPLKSLTSGGAHQAPQAETRRR